MQSYNTIVPPQLALKAIDRILYLKALSEHYFFKFMNSQSYTNKMKISSFLVFFICSLIGAVSGKLLVLLWKPYIQWSFVELIAIMYTWYNMGYYTGKSLGIYLGEITLGNFDHSKYNFETIKPEKKNSYLNPIDLTQLNFDDVNTVETLLSFIKHPNTDKSEESTKLEESTEPEESTEESTDQKKEN